MIIIDFDGTIVDIWVRYHSIFCDLTGIMCSLDEYISVKKSVLKDEAVASALNGKLPADYFARKRELLEDLSYLSLDRLMVSREDLLKVLSMDNAIILTKRRYPDNLYKEMELLGLSKIREKVVVICDGSKKEYVSSMRLIDEEIIVLGDSVIDLEIGGLPQTRCIINGSGLSNREQLDSVGIDYIYKDNAHDAWKYMMELMSM